ncbi:MAG: hypothetical protein K1X83_08820 [Oligoflexia bacterium]|nr:hypothetical protein [Oligoflexia bacterium]
MDIVQFIKESGISEGQARFPGGAFQAYFETIFSALDLPGPEEQLIAAILNFSVQQLSNRSAFEAAATGLAHITARPWPYFAAALLRVPSRIEARLLPLEELDPQTANRIRATLASQSKDEARNPWLYSVLNQKNLQTVCDGTRGLLHLIDYQIERDALGAAQALFPRLGRYADVLTIGPKSSTFGQLASSFEYYPEVSKKIGNLTIELFRREPLPKAGRLPWDQAL